MDFGYFSKYFNYLVCVFVHVYSRSINYPRDQIESKNIAAKIYIYICLFHTHMVYCYIMTNIIMNTHNNNNNKRYNKILKSADSISR